MIDWDSLEDALIDEPPLFFVQPPDSRRDWTEAGRQRTLLQICQYHAPEIHVHPVPNAGKRNPMQARREGIRAGVFDLVFHSAPVPVAYVEFKGWRKSGSAGKLDKNQIAFGNAMTRFGIPVACFFDPYDAYEWLLGIGFPGKAVRRAA